MEQTKSQRIVRALQQLEQFQPYISSSQDHTLHVLTGALISAHMPPEDEDNGMIKIQFPGGPEHVIVGETYLKLQILESAAHELHADASSNSPIARRADELSEHLWRKHDLE